MRHRTVVVGDVHGCVRELDALFTKLNLTANDTVVSLGDIFDKGPDSVNALRRFKAVNARLTLGNHEERLIRFLAHEQRIAAIKAANPKQTPPSNPMKNTAAFQGYLDAMTPDEMAYLMTAKVYIPLPEHGAMVIHAGVMPTVTKLPAPDFATLKGKDKELAAKLIRVRFVSADKGEMIPLGENKPEDPFWADVYTDNRFGHVFFGHDPVLKNEPRRFSHAVGLDTGCVFGGFLTAAVLTPGEPNEFVSVPAFEKYAERMYEE